MNGDDAITVHDKTHDFVFRDSIIGFETHGMSIGSLGKDASKSESISNLLFQNITIDGGLYATRLKSWVGGQGLVKNVTWTGIKMRNVTFPAFITQKYQDQIVDKNTNTDNSQAVAMEGKQSLANNPHKPLNMFRFHLVRLHRYHQLQEPRRWKLYIQALLVRSGSSASEA